MVNDNRWKIFATEASIAFVNEAEDVIDSLMTHGASGKDDGVIKSLESAITDIVSKKVVLMKTLSVDDFLKTGKLPE